MSHYHVLLLDMCLFTMGRFSKAWIVYLLRIFKNRTICLLKTKLWIASSILELLYLLFAMCSVDIFYHDQ